MIRARDSRLVRVAATFAQVLLGSTAMLSVACHEPALAGPVNEVLDIPFLAERWQYAPGDPRLLPPVGRGWVRASYDSFNIYRHKEEGLRTDLQRIRGPALELAYNGWDGFFAIEASDYAMTSQWVERSFDNRLDGAQDSLRLDLGARLPLGGEQRVVIACRLEQGNLALDGVMPSALDRVPGFSTADTIRHGWDDENWLASARYEYPGGAMHASYGQNRGTPSLSAMAADDDVDINLPLTGSVWTGGLEFSLEQRAVGELFFGRLHMYGDDRIYQHANDIGPLRASHQAQQLGLRVYEPLSQSWDFSVIAGKYSTALSGSARLAGFDGSLWGITAPRGHLDSWLSYRAVTVLLDRAGGRCGGGDWRYNLGLTRFDLDSRIDSWGTVLFGAARVDENHRALPLESGWIGHAGLSASWKLGMGELTAAVSQSVPFNAYREKADDDVPPVVESADGGRVIAVAYTISF